MHLNDVQIKWVYDQLSKNQRLFERFIADVPFTEFKIDDIVDINKGYELIPVEQNGEQFGVFMFERTARATVCKLHGFYSQAAVTFDLEVVGIIKAMVKRTFTETSITTIMSSFPRQQLDTSILLNRCGFKCIYRPSNRNEHIVWICKRSN